MPRRTLAMPIPIPCRDTLFLPRVPRPSNPSNPLTSNHLPRHALPMPGPSNPSPRRTLVLSRVPRPFNPLPRSTFDPSSTHFGPAKSNPLPRHTLVLPRPSKPLRVSDVSYKFYWWAITSVVPSEINVCCVVENRDWLISTACPALPRSQLLLTQLCFRAATVLSQHWEASCRPTDTFGVYSTGVGCFSGKIPLQMHLDTKFRGPNNRILLTTHQLFSYAQKKMCMYKK